MNLYNSQNSAFRPGFTPWKLAMPKPTRFLMMSHGVQGGVQ